MVQRKSVRGSARVRVTERTSAASISREDRVVVEEPLEIRLAAPARAATRSTVTMRTPGHDFELAAGWMFHEGVVARADDIATVAYCTDADLSEEERFNVVTLTARAILRDPSPRALANSACGVCGTSSISEVFAHLPTTRSPSGQVSGDLLASLPNLMREHQPVFDRTGGLHAAALFSEAGDLLAIREDVGRHNAVDKVTGSQLLNGVEPNGGLMCTSGRLGFEIVQKSIASGRLAIVGVGAPTSLAVSLAQEAGVVLIGFAREDRYVIYSRPDLVT